jgi:hypothetical protein
MYINLRYNYIDKSYNDIFPKNFKLSNSIGEGSSCIVYNFVNNYVIKIYKTSNSIHYFNNLFLELNNINLYHIFENNYNKDGLNEFKFFYKFLDKINHNNIPIPIAYGILKFNKKNSFIHFKNKFNNNNNNNSTIHNDLTSFYSINSDTLNNTSDSSYSIESYNDNNKYFIFIILPFFNHIYKNSNLNIINSEKFLINLINVILSVEKYIQTNFNLTNLDIKLDNILIDNSLNFKIIDFGLIININDHNILDNRNNYFIWPKKPTKINKICLYSIFLLIYQILFKNFNNEMYSQIYNFDNPYHLLNNIKNNFYYSDNFIFILDNLLNMNFEIDFYIQFINYNFFDFNHISNFYNKYFIDYFSKYKLN